MKFPIASSAAALAVAAALSGPASATSIRHAAVAVAPGFALTATQAFPTAFVTRDLGPAPANMPVNVTVGLVTRNDALIPQIIARQNTPGDSMYHQYLTPAQSNALYSPSGAQVQAVASYLTSKGFTHLIATPDNEFVYAMGTVATADAAFNAGIHLAQTGATQSLVNTLPATVPVSLASTVRGVLGLETTRLHNDLAFRTAGSTCTVNPATGSCALNDFGPREYWYAYDTAGYAIAGKGFTADFRNGIKTPIAVFGEGDLSGVVKDLRIFENAHQLPQTAYQVVIPTMPSTDTAGADEFDLDTQYTTGMAGNVKFLTIYDAASLSNAELAMSFDRFKTDDSSLAGNASFGECDSLASALGFTAMADPVFGQAATQGQSVFASTGDTGTGCRGAVNGTPAGVPGTEYPASSTYVVAVGGTTLFTKPDNTYQGEVVWNSGGGGLSAVEKPGAWQAGVVPAAATTANQRGIPDISLDADPNTGANVIVAGANTQIGGTSLSAPLAVGVWARLQTQNNNTLGFAAPRLYKEFADLQAGAPAPPTGYFTRTVGGFNDVLTGTMGFPATTGWDFATGMGSIDIDKTLTNLFK